MFAFLTACHLATALSASIATSLTDFSMLHEGISSLSSHIEENEALFPSNVKAMVKALGAKYSLGEENRTLVIWTTLCSAMRPFQSKDDNLLKLLPRISHGNVFPYRSTAVETQAPKDMQLHVIDVLSMSLVTPTLDEPYDHQIAQLRKRLTDVSVGALINRIPSN